MIWRKCDSINRKFEQDRSHVVPRPIDNTRYKVQTLTNTDKHSLEFGPMLYQSHVIQQGENKPIAWGGTRRNSLRECANSCVTAANFLTKILNLYILQ